MRSSVSKRNCKPSRNSAGAPRRGKRAARRANQLRSEQATVGRPPQLSQALIRNHGYSTDTVRRLLKPGALGQADRPSARSLISLR
jgi:hypothetical protein